VNAPRPSPWQRQAAARPLLAWRTAQLAPLAAAFDAALQGWAADWGLLPDAATRCDNAHPRAVSGWQLLGRRSEGAAWLLRGSQGEAQLTRQLVGTDTATTPVAMEAIAACRFDLRARLAAAWQLEPAGSGVPDQPPAVLAVWGGSVEATLAFDTHVLLDVACLASLPGASHAREAAPAWKESAADPLVPVGEAMTDLPLTLQAQLEPCAIAVGSLQDLQVGDVVRLQHPLHLPVAIHDERGSVLCAGHLARRRGFKAVELAPASIGPSCVHKALP
jgi:flagellar motor switch/type III secretory pathway protein FliN